MGKVNWYKLHDVPAGNWIILDEHMRGKVTGEVPKNRPKKKKKRHSQCGENPCQICSK